MSKDKNVFGPQNNSLELATHAYNSYVKHCGTSALRLAEDDLLGQVLNALRDLVEHGTEEMVDTGIGMLPEPTKAYQKAKTILEQLPEPDDSES